jgi:hypothetical protein
MQNGCWQPEILVVDNKFDCEHFAVVAAVVCALLNNPRRKFRKKRREKKEKKRIKNKLSLSLLKQNLYTNCTNKSQE